MILPRREQARLQWYLRWSEAELSGLRSSAGAVITQLEMRAQLLSVPVEKSFCTVRPRTTTPFDASGAEDEFLGRVQAVREERTIRRALLALTRRDAEALVLAYGVDLLVAREGFGPWGNLADRTARAEALPAPLFDRLAARAAAGKELTERQAAHRRAIAWECEQLASRVADIYLEGLRHGRPTDVAHRAGSRHAPQNVPLAR